MTIRCPRCRKKHDDPAPERCGCGESLLALLVAQRQMTREARAEAAPSLADSPSELKTATGALNAPTGSTDAADAAPANPKDNQW